MSHCSYCRTQYTAEHRFCAWCGVRLTPKTGEACAYRRLLPGDTFRWVAGITPFVVTTDGGCRAINPSKEGHVMYPSGWEQVVPLAG